MTRTFLTYLRRITTNSRQIINALLDCGEGATQQREAPKLRTPFFLQLASFVALIVRSHGAQRRMLKERMSVFTARTIDRIHSVEFRFHFACFCLLMCRKIEIQHSF